MRFVIAVYVVTKKAALTNFTGGIFGTSKL